MLKSCLIYQHLSNGGVLCLCLYLFRAMRLMTVLQHFLNPCS